MISLINKHLARPSAYGWALCAFVLLITTLASPINAAASVIVDGDGPFIHHKMVTAQDNHNADMSSFRMSCDDPACKNNVDCDKTCSLNVNCGNGASTVAGPIAQSVLIAPFRTQLPKSFLSVVIVPRQSDLLFRPPIT